MASPNYKVVLLGNSGVGKTCLLERFHTDTFLSSTNSSAGVEFITKTVSYGNENLKIQIWDTAGQERFRSLTQSTYKGAKGIMLVYNIADRQTFDNLSNVWMPVIRDSVLPTCIILLIGNKCDLADKYRQVSVEEADCFARENCISFLETSALDKTNVERAFSWLVKEMVNQHYPIRTQGRSNNNNNNVGGNKPSNLRPADNKDMKNRNSCFNC